MYGVDFYLGDQKIWGQLWQILEGQNGPSSIQKVCVFFSGEARFRKLRRQTLGEAAGPRNQGEARLRPLETCELTQGHCHQNIDIGLTWEGRVLIYSVFWSWSLFTRYRDADDDNHTTDNTCCLLGLYCVPEALLTSVVSTQVEPRVEETRNNIGEFFALMKLIFKWRKTNNKNISKYIGNWKVISTLENERSRMNRRGLGKR